MSFEVKIHTDNAAFEENAPAEVARILRAIAAKLDHGDHYDKFQTVLDINGNYVGRWKLELPERKPLRFTAEPSKASNDAWVVLRDGKVFASFSWNPDPRASAEAMAARFNAEEAHRGDAE